MSCINRKTPNTSNVLSGHEIATRVNSHPIGKLRALSTVRFYVVQQYVSCMSDSTTTMYLCAKDLKVDESGQIIARKMAVPRLDGKGNTFVVLVYFTGLEKAPTPLTLKYDNTTQLFLQ